MQGNALNFVHVYSICFTCVLYFDAGKVFLVFAATACYLIGLAIAKHDPLACDSDEGSAMLESCRTDLLNNSGHNFTEDCEDGIVKDFMRCLDAAQGCRNISAFAEHSLSDHYGCMDTDIVDHSVQKRSWVRRLVCRVACSFTCGTGEYIPHLYNDGYRR